MSKLQTDSSQPRGISSSYTDYRVHAVTAMRPGADPGVEIGGGHMASAKREPIMGVWGPCLQRGPGAEPLVRGLGGEAPLKLNAFGVVICLKWR